MKQTRAKRKRADQHQDQTETSPRKETRDKGKEKVKEREKRKNNKKEKEKKKEPEKEKEKEMEEMEKEKEMEKEAEPEDTDAEDSKPTRKHRGKSWSWHANFTFLKIMHKVGVNWGKILHEMHARHLATECTLPAQMRERWKVLSKDKSCVWKKDWPGKKWDPRSVPKGTHKDAVRLLEERHAEAVAKRERQMEHAQDWIHKIKAREVVLDSEGTQRTGVASDSEECQRSTPCSTGPPLEVGRGNSCSRKQMSRSRDFPCTDDCGNGCTCRQNGADDGRVPWTPKPASSCKTD